MRVLVVDDERLMRSAVARCFLDHDVWTASRATEALALLKGSAYFDVIICDIEMGGMCGDELYVEVLAHAPERAPHFLFVTGGALSERAQTFIETVPNPVLLKPFKTSTLRQVAVAVAFDAAGGPSRRT